MSTQPSAPRAPEAAQAGTAARAAARPAVPWQRLDARMIWVDVVRSLLSVTPTGLAVAVFGAEPDTATMWPVIMVAVVGVGGAVSDALRWVKTRYRVTDTHVERRTGLLVRKYRSIRRDRIRSVEQTAKLRHRLAGLRLVTIGAGQQAAAGEALSLDAVSRDTAAALRRQLLRGQTQPADAVTAEPGPAGAEVLARFCWSWVAYNVFNMWAYVMAGGLLWGAYWGAGTLGLDARGIVTGLLDPGRLGWGWTVAIAAAVTGAIGVLGLAVNFFVEHWDFTLARVRAGHGAEQRTVLRTSQGLFSTREVNRDEGRLRGVEITEPVLWRWMGLAETNVITTGLAVWSMTPATTILPRGPVSVARPVAAAVLGADPSPLEVPLRRHPAAALRRRLVWATALTSGAAAALAWLAAVTTVIPGWAWLAATAG